MSDKPYRGSVSIFERLKESPAPSLTRIYQDRRDAAARIEALEVENAKLRATTDRIARVDDSLAKQLRTSIENNAVLNTRAEAAERALAEAVEVMRPVADVTLPWGDIGAGMILASDVQAARAFIQQHEGKK